jgi:oligosaccharide repeat unit polymerase
MKPLTYHRKRPPLALPLAFFLAAAALSAPFFLAATGWRVRAHAGQLEWPLLLLLGLACILPAAVDWLRGRLMVFEPVHIYAFSTLVYFVIVPAILISQDAFVFAGMDYRFKLPDTLLLALLSLLGFYLGYLPGRQMAPVGQTWITAAVLRYARRWAILLLILFSAMIALWIMIARMPLQSLWVLGDAAYGDAWDLAQGVQIGYLSGAREAVPACLLLLLATGTTRRARQVAVVLLVVYTLLLAGPGGRYYVLLPTLGLIVYYFLATHKRPALWQVAVAAFLIFYFVIGGLGFFRIAGNELGQTRFTLAEAWDTFLSGTQIATSTAASVWIVPEHAGYLKGASFLQLLTQPIPRFLWPGKPSWFGPEALLSYWVYSAAAPFWVSFYLNFGPIGLAAGTALLGWLSRKIYNAYVRDPANVFAQVLLALYIPFMIHGYGRGSNEPAFVIYGAVYVLFPVVWTWALSRRRFRRAETVAPAPIA